MDFEWDASKAISNEKKHGIPFEYATRVFLDSCLLKWKDTRTNYGEERMIVMGTIEKRLFVVAITKPGNTTRIISARKGNAREKKHYQLHTQP